MSALVLPPQARASGVKIPGARKLLLLLLLLAMSMRLPILIPGLKVILAWVSLPLMSMILPSVLLFVTNWMNAQVSKSVSPLVTPVILSKLKSD